MFPVHHDKCIPGQTAIVLILIRTQAAQNAVSLNHTMPKMETSTCTYRRKSSIKYYKIRWLSSIKVQRVALSYMNINMTIKVDKDD